MCSSETAAVGIGELAVPLRGEFEQDGMRQGDHFFLRLTVGRGSEKLHVDGVGMANRNACLKPAKLHVPSLSEGVRTRLKRAAFVTHDPMLTCSGKREIHAGRDESGTQAG